MARVKFKPAAQKKFLIRIKKVSGLTWKNLADCCNINGRTLRDWAREKYTADRKRIFILSKKFKIPLEGVINSTIDDYWYVERGARLGGLARHKIYGLVGDIESRRKGGLVSQQRRRENPEKYRLLGCNIRKNFKITKYSEALAELAGIIMGDGGITNTQVRITLNKSTDRAYARFVLELIKQVIGETPSWVEYKSTICLTISGVSFVEELERIGLRRGNKALHQISFPVWISQKKKYRVACIRGLFDTDGGLYFHKHWVKGLGYRNLGFCFTNNSKPLIAEFAKTLSLLNLNFKKVKENRIYIYNLNEIIKFINIVGSNNKKNLQKLSFHLVNSKKLIN